MIDNKVHGRVWQFGDGIDTDLMLPMHASLRQPEEQQKFIFEANRPGWVDQAEGGDIIVAGRNFGIGSARPAARVLRDFGIAAVVAEGVNGLFMRNAVNFGLLCMEAPGVLGIFDEMDSACIHIDSWIVENERSGLSVPGRPVPDDLKQLMLSGGLRRRLEEAGYIAPAPSR